MYLYNAEIFTATGEIIKNGYVEITGRHITDVGEGEPSDMSFYDIDCNGGKLFPGFIDAHTHMGLFESGVGIEGEDCNEDSDPVTPDLRTIDGINPMDENFSVALSYGITTVATGCGSANPIGGDVIAIRTSGRYADEMLIKPVGIKFALGENPKSVYSEKDSAPVTRMATAAIIREALFKAKRYMEDKKKAIAENDDLPEYDAKCEALEPLLKKKIKAFFHCHKANDIMTAVRIAKEFDLDYSLVHCTEGHLLADVLGEQRVRAAVGPVISDKGKPELMGLSVKNAATLRENGVSVSICTDHPELPIQYLSLSAAIANKNGLSYEDSIKAITRNAAKFCGIDDILGSIEKGKIADIVMFSENPLGVEVKPTMVMVNGKIIERKE